MSEEQSTVLHLMEIKATLARLEAQVLGIDRAVNGNGQPGLSQKVEDLQGAKNKLWGVGAAITFLWGLLEYLIHRHH